MHHDDQLNNPHYNDCYFAYGDGLTEANYVFIDPLDIPKRIANSKETYIIGETGFGTGLNLLALLKALKKYESIPSLRFVSVEKYPLSPDRIVELFEGFSDDLKDELELFLPSWGKAYSSLQEGWNRFSLNDDFFSVDIDLFIGDVSLMMQSLPCKMDSWFLDGHSPSKNPDMWTPEILVTIAEHTVVEGTLSTFTAAGIVKRTFRENGFTIKRLNGFLGKRHMIIGIKDKDNENNTVGM